MVHKGQPKIPVGARTFAKGFPLATPAPAVDPEPAPVSIPSGTPAEPLGIPFPAPPGVESIATVLDQRISEIPARWVPTPDQLAALLARMGMAANTQRPAVIAGVAETQIAQEFGSLSLKDLIPVAAIPLVKQLLKRVKVRPGVLGKPGRMDPVRPASTFRTSPGRTAPAFQPQTSGRGLPPRPVQPAQTKGFGGGHTRNMTAFMEFLQKKPGSRRITPFKQADPNL